MWELRCQERGQVELWGQLTQEHGLVRQKEREGGGREKDQRWGRGQSHRASSRRGDVSVPGKGVP